MLRSARLLLPLLALLAVAPPATARAAGATATFTGVFEAKRDVRWTQPRGVHKKDCQGEHWYAASGTDHTSVKTRKAFKVTVQRMGRAHFWTFGSGKVTGPRDLGIEAGGRTTRSFKSASGTSGGWCGGGDEESQPENDCGTRLPTWMVMLQAGSGKLTFSMDHASWVRNERLSYYKCEVVTPEGMFEATFGLDRTSYRVKDLFDRRRRTIVIGDSKAYDDAWPVPNVGVTRTATGSESFKLTLTRTK